VPFQGVVAAHDDEGPDLVFGKVGQGPDQNVDRTRTQRRGRFGGKAPDSDPFKDLPEFFLEDNDNDDQEDREEALKDPGRQLQLQLTRDDINRRQDEHPPDDESCPGPLCPNDSGVEQDRDKKNIDHIGNGDRE